MCCWDQHTDVITCTQINETITCAGGAYMHTACFHQQLNAELLAVGRRVIKIKKHALFPPLLTHLLHSLPFLLLVSGLYSAPVLLFPFGNVYSYYVSMCFARPCQFILDPAYETDFATQCHFLEWYKPFQCNLISSCLYFPICAKCTAWGFIRVFCFYSVCGRTN